MTCKLNPLTPFEGKSKIRLMGLPNGVTAPEIEVASGAKEATFNVATTDKARTGQNRGLFCQLALTLNGEEIVQAFAPNGVLRIDAPKAVKKPE